MLALNDHRSRVNKESDDYWQNDTDRWQEEYIDLTDISESDDSCSRSFEHVHDCKGKRVVEDAKVAGELV